MKNGIGGGEEKLMKMKNPKPYDTQNLTVSIGFCENLGFVCWLALLESREFF